MCNRKIWTNLINYAKSIKWKVFRFTDESSRGFFRIVPSTAINFLQAFDRSRSQKRACFRSFCCSHIESFLYKSCAEDSKTLFAVVVTKASPQSTSLQPTFRGRKFIVGIFITTLQKLFLPSLAIFHSKPWHRRKIENVRILLWHRACKRIFWEFLLWH